MTSFLTGFAIGLSLIVAIGAQNAFVLRQGLRKQHVGLVVATCIISDGLLIAAGVAGFGALTSAMPMLEPITRWGGAIFLFVYGALSLRRAVFATDSLNAEGTAEQSAYSAVLTCLALTWLNPHVYLDTVILLGAIAAQYGDAAWVFGAGAIVASTVFFLCLGFGARLLQPFFTKPFSWRVLDVGVGLLMWAIAVTLIWP
jgi:L-lysine exporter family protein LysE/ArgO